jgi:hypothetical protein
MRLSKLAAALLLVAAFGCRTAAEKQRMTIAEARNINNAKRAAYTAACLPTTPPELAAACWEWFDKTTACAKAIQTATDATGVGPAELQIEAMQRACSAVKSLGETP